MKVTLFNCLETIRPDLAKEWHTYKNGNLTPQHVVAGGITKYWWQCMIEPDHAWFTSIHKRISGKTGCPYCSGNKVCLSNSLFTTHPNIAAEFHISKNVNLTSKDVSFGSSKKFYWQCKKNDSHIWQSSIAHRVRGDNCTICSRRKITPTNCLSVTNPSLIKEWHPTFNVNISPEMITAGSGTLIYWQCSLNKNHVWKAPVYSRTGKYQHGCPNCKLKCEQYTYEILKKIFSSIEIKRRNKIYIEIKLNNNIIRKKIYPDFSFTFFNKKYIVEYNGHHHYHSVIFGSYDKKKANSNFVDQCARDLALREYCKNKNIYLVEIDGRSLYSKGNIEKYLINMFSNISKRNFSGSTFLQKN